MSDKILHSKRLKFVAISLSLLPFISSNAADYQSNDGSVVFTVACQNNGSLKVKLLDTEKPRNLMITSLDYLPMVPTTGIMSDIYRKGYTPFEELIRYQSFEYKDFSYGKKNGTIKINQLKEYVTTCENDFLKRKTEKEKNENKIKKDKEERTKQAEHVKLQQELKIIKEKQYAVVKARKARKDNLNKKEIKLLSINPKWQYQGNVAVNDITGNQGSFVTVNLSAYQLYQQLDEKNYLFRHLSNLKAFPPVVLTSDSFYREGYNGPQNIDVIHYGYSHSHNGQIIKLTEVE